VNAPESGTIKELLVNEEDTVTVGQDLVRLETGGEKPAEQSKEESKPEPSKSDPPPKEEPKQEPPKQEPPKQEPPKQDEPPVSPKQESKPAPPKEEKKPSPQPTKKAAPKTEEDGDKMFKLWSRDERRVSVVRDAFSQHRLIYLGENESHAPSDCRALETGPKHSRLAINIPGS